MELTTTPKVITTTIGSAGAPDITSGMDSIETTTPGKTGLTKHYRDGENDITGATTTTTTAATKVAATTPATGEDVKGPFDYRTTPKMKTTRIDTSNELDEFNITTLLTTTPKYDSTTFPVVMVTEEIQANENFTTPRIMITEKSTMFPVITPESTTKSQEPVTMAGTTLSTPPEMMEPLTTTTTKELLTPDITTYRPTIMVESPSSSKPQVVEDLTTTMFPVITEKATEMSEIPGTTTSISSVNMEVETTTPMVSFSQLDNKTKIGIIGTSTTTESITTTIPSLSTTTTTTPSTLITVINTTCTVHTNCAPNQLCIMGQCRFKCRGDGTNENNCVKGIIFKLQVTKQKFMYKIRFLNEFRKKF